MRTNIITSSSNETVKLLRKLESSSRFRYESGLSLADGIHLVQAALTSGLRFRYVVVAQSAIGNIEVDDLLQKLSGTAEIIFLSDNLFKSVSTVHAKSGILVVFQIPELHTRGAINIDDSVVLLDQVQDPGNLGAILRTAAAVGIDYVCLSEGSASVWSPKALRAGMGAQFGLRLCESVNLLDIIKGIDFPLVATTLREDSVSLYEADLSGKCAWVFGNEGRGVNEAFLDMANIKISVPQKNQAVESLNVASAAAVCLYEQYRQQLQG